MLGKGNDCLIQYLYQEESKVAQSASIDDFRFSFRDLKLGQPENNKHVPKEDNVHGSNDCQIQMTSE